MTVYPTPQSGASLLLSLTPSATSPTQNTLLLLSPTRISALRTFAALEAGYKVVIGASKDCVWDEELDWRRGRGEVEVIDWEVKENAGTQEWDHWFDTVDKNVTEGCMLIGLGDTMLGSKGVEVRRTEESALAFKLVANRRRYLVNISDKPHLSDFSWPVTHRFDLAVTSASSPASTSAPLAKSPLQLALTTNSSACRLASRLRREVVAALPTNVGNAVLAVSSLRKALAASEDVEEGDLMAPTGLNRPVEQLTREKSAALEKGGEMSSAAVVGDKQKQSESSITSWTAAEAQRTRMRYVAQLSEYWPLDRLANVDISALSTPASTPPGSNSPILPPDSHHSLALSLPAPPPQQKGRIILLGTGTGNPLLLTRLAHLFLTAPVGSPYHVDLFLSDKLVPSEILDLIPSERRAGVVIAKKYPGNAEHAQDELMRLAVEGAKEGKTVMRMKQGDPFLYGRGGEELLHFRKAGFESVVVPGLSSCLAGPTIVGIPVTQRGVAESMVVCTGVGRGGREVAVDAYERGKTLVVLMGVARLEALVARLKERGYPGHLPMALVERASSPDQRVVKSTVDGLVGALKRISAHRPPGMLVIGWAVLCMDGEGDMTTLDAECEGEQKDRERVEKWLGEEGFSVKEGLGESWRSIVEGAAAL